MDEAYWKIFLNGHSFLLQASKICALEIICQIMNDGNYGKNAYKSTFNEQ